MSETSAYIVTLKNGEDVRVICSSWMLAGAMACKQYREDNPDADESGISVVDIKSDGPAHDMVTWRSK